MKLAFQIAAGILIASGVLWLGSIVVMGAAVQTVLNTVPPALQPRPALPNASSEALARELAARQNAALDAEQARQRAQQARCTVVTADGRELHCDPGDPFTPR